MLRKRVTQYASLGNNIEDRPQSVQVQDGYGNVITSSIFSSGNFGLETPSGATPNRNNVTGARGNLTTRHDPQGTSTFHYDMAGQVAYSSDLNINRTDYQYDSGTGAVVARLARPSTNGVQHVTQASINGYTGLPDSLTDENNIVTQISYDSSLRETLKQPAAGTAT